MGFFSWVASDTKATFVSNLVTKLEAFKTTKFITQVTSTNVVISGEYNGFGVILNEEGKYDIFANAQAGYEGYTKKISQLDKESDELRERYFSGPAKEELVKLVELKESVRDFKKMPASHFIRSTIEPYDH